MAAAQSALNWPQEAAAGPEGPRGFFYDGARAGRTRKAGLSRRHAGGRPLPMEDVLLYIKDIDNSQLRREADPSDRRNWLRMVAAGFLLLTLTVLCFGPRAWLRHSNFKQAELTEKRMELEEIERHLRVRVAQLSDLRRVARLAEAQGLTAPTNDHYAWQYLTIETGQAEGALAGAYPAEQPLVP